ncbi:hypothetical protein [Pseudomonas sp. B21-010]|uniref:hypothetical protein n=1 Tax=Pseudomonas sp. B21-010 TaxID=2895471 RepID=UPI00215E081F|nr:hypothetical protein [Pseudomonas sp. B21-010]UVM59761.1 hypothetical protein LOY50_19700 [Pseudomonas sp. B21-010]
MSALKKFAVLWVLTSLPVIFAALLSPVNLGGDAALSDWIDRLSESISVSEQFVYTASFLTPILYIWYEKYINSSQDSFNKKLSQSLRELFNGYGTVVFTALLMILLTASAFSALKTNPDNFKSTYLNLFLTKYSVFIYLFALYCWYLSLLDGIHAGDFVVATRKSEKMVSNGLAERLKFRGDT